MVLTTLTLASAASADLIGDAERVAAAWQALGLRVVHGVPLFVEQTQPRQVAVEWDGSANPARCTTAAFLADRGVGFTVTMAGSAETTEAGPSAHSAAGMMALTRCGSERAKLRDLTLSVGTDQATVEVLVAHGERAATLDEVLEDRRVGEIAPAGKPGPGMRMGELRARIAEAEQRSRRDGAARVGVFPMRASGQGAGNEGLNLVPGCHRLDLMAEVSGGATIDVDADLHDVEQERLLSRDRGAAPDARLEVCVGAETRAGLSYVGAPSGARVVVVDAVWPLPRGVSPRWGARARGGFAAAMRRAGAPEVMSPPAAESLGGQGVTWVPVEVSPGACYVAAVALVRGEAAGLGLSAMVDDLGVRDIVAERAEGAALAFCSERATTARLRVQAQGQHPWWALGLWEVTTP